MGARHVFTSETEFAYQFCIPSTFPVDPRIFTSIREIWYEIALHEEIRSHIVDNTDRLNRTR